VSRFEETASLLPAPASWGQDPPRSAQPRHTDRRGASDEPTDWIATTDLLDEMLCVADVLVISAALTTATKGLIGARELSLMKENAILINVARSEIIDEERSTRILSPIRTFSPASTRGGWNRCGMATSRWVTRFSTFRT
jgi:D-isomer specific 2-hydroxyacid dehydrogenase, NAD binding domain